MSSPFAGRTRQRAAPAIRLDAPTNGSPACAASQRSEPFARVAELGDEFEAGLLALLFDDPELQRWVREYLIF